MVMQATVRVRSEKGARPSRSGLAQVAQELAHAGFEVQSVGRFGVKVAAEPRRFRETFGVDLPVAGGTVEVPSEGASPSLDGLVDLIEVLPEPEYFNKR